VKANEFIRPLMRATPLSPTEAAHLQIEVPTRIAQAKCPQNTHTE
jgi:hypothetical protein